MIPNIDILTEEITDEEHPNETYGITKGKKVIFKKCEKVVDVPQGTSYFVENISPFHPIKIEADTSSASMVCRVQFTGKNVNPGIMPTGEKYIVSKDADGNYTATFSKDNPRGSTTIMTSLSSFAVKALTISFNLINTTCKTRSLYIAYSIKHRDEGNTQEFNYTFDVTPGKKSHTIIIPENHTVRGFYFQQGDVNDDGVTTFSNFQIEIGDTATQYENYWSEYVNFDEFENVIYFNPHTACCVAMPLGGLNYIPYTIIYATLDSNDIVMGDYIDGLDAVKQAIFLILSTERYEFPIYSWDYGVELIDLYGKPMPYVMSELPRRITEALTQDNRIDDVIDFEFEKNGKKLHTTFTVVTNAGNVYTDLEVDV